MSGNLLQQIRDQGVSLWLDGVTRDELRSGSFRALIDNFGVSGLTTSPRQFAKSLVGSLTPYGCGLRDLATRGASAAEAARLLTAQDAREACDILSAVHRESAGREGWVLLGVDPQFADDVEATLADVRTLAWMVNRPNLMVKVPATKAGVSVIEAATAEGYNIHATLIPSAERYMDVLDAYAFGLERAGKARIKLASIHSAASMLVPRVDTELAAWCMDQTRINLSSPSALFGVVNGRHAYRQFSEAMRTSSWRRLVAAGANPQRLLWAPARGKGSTLDETAYFAGLALPGTISAMTLETLASAAQLPSQPMSAGMLTRDEANEIRACEELGEVSDALMAHRLADGVARAQKSWLIALHIADERLNVARADRLSAQR